MEGEDVPFEHMGSSYWSRHDRGRNFNSCFRLRERCSRERCGDKCQCHREAHLFSLKQQSSVGKRSRTN